jgi:hypothetical protein
MVYRVREAFLDCAVHFNVRACDEQPVAVGGQPLGDGRNLFGRLTLAENDFWEAFTQRPVMVDGGEAQVFVGQVPQALECFVDGQAAVADRLQQLFESRLVDR